MIRHALDRVRFGLRNVYVRQNDRGKNGDHGNRHQKLNQSEAVAAAALR